jgi:hypothetical protein
MASRYCEQTTPILNEKNPPQQTEAAIEKNFTPFETEP